MFTSGTGGDQAWLPCSVMLVPATSRGCFSYSCRSLKGCALPPTLLKASNIISIENLLISYHLSARGCSKPFPTDAPALARGKADLIFFCHPHASLVKAYIYLCMLLVGLHLPLLQSNT